MQVTCTLRSGLPNKVTLLRCNRIVARCEPNELHDHYEVIASSELSVIFLAM